MGFRPYLQVVEWLVALANAIRAPMTTIQGGVGGPGLAAGEAVLAENAEDRPAAGPRIMPRAASPGSRAGPLALPATPFR